MTERTEAQADAAAEAAAARQAIAKKIATLARGVKDDTDAADRPPSRAGVRGARDGAASDGGSAT